MEGFDQDEKLKEYLIEQDISISIFVLFNSLINFLGIK